MDTATDEEETVCQCNPCLCDDPSGRCMCDPCYCDTPEQTPVAHTSRSLASLHPEDEEQTGPLPYIEISNLGRGFILDEFIRAKEYLMVPSSNSGLSVYDHLSELIRKILDERNPPNMVDFMEEISLNIKRYRFGLGKELVHDTHYIPVNVLSDAFQMVQSWKKHALWSVQQQAETAGESSQRPNFGGFPNLMRLLYYLEQVNVGLPREEMLRIALAIRELSMSQPVNRARFWGKIYGIYKNYYVLEVEMKGVPGDEAWQPRPTTPPGFQDMIDSLNFAGDFAQVIPGAGATFQRAGGAVTNPEILTLYDGTSGLPPGATTNLKPPLPTQEEEFYGEDLQIEYDDPDAAAELARWQEYQNELMSGYPIPPYEETMIIPPEANGTNRRNFYICNELGDPWTRLPDVTPQQINFSRLVRWHLSGDLNSRVKTVPEFPGREGNFLRALLARITAGSQVSPRGYFKTKKSDEYGGEDEEDEEDEDDEEEEFTGDDTVYPIKKYRPELARILNPDMNAWVHHTGHILRQGRMIWWNPKKIGGEEEDDEELGEEEEDEDEEQIGREFGPNLFSNLNEDKTLDGVTPWSTRGSSSVFTEFQVACARSNLWPGATAICTSKGKVENIYFGDGLKFRSGTYSPFVPEETQVEYTPGPELTEVNDPTVEEEKAWMAKLQLDAVADIEDEFRDNEEGVDEEDEEESEED